METYKLWVRKNKDFVYSLESLANGVTWLLPERFSDSEVGPEAVYAFLGILSSVNQHIIDTTPPRVQPPYLSKVESSFPWSLCVSTLKDLETVVEVAAQHYFGEDGKWNFLAITEGIKAMVRLALLKDSGYKMLLQGGVIPNVEQKESNHHGAVGPLGKHGGQFQGYTRNGYTLSMEGRARSALSKFGENARMASFPMQTNQFLRNHNTTANNNSELMEKPTLATIWSKKPLFLTGESFFIMRPLIYVLLIRKYGIRSWTPWLFSLFMDLTGMSIISYITNPSRTVGDEFYPASNVEKDELKRRKLIWALYVMRDPFFTKYTKEHLQKTNTYLGKIPFVGMLADKIVELALGAQTRYTYISGS